MLDLLRTLWSDGRAAYVVGGSIRDVLLDRVPYDWDLATAALPERTQALFPGSVYENRFGTVAVRTDDPAAPVVQITTFRSDHDYADFRRPHHIEFGESVELDLARRDLTVNAIAWGAEPGAEPRLVDPYGGQPDLDARLLRAVGDPRQRFEEDALRMLRVARLAATLGFDVEASTLAGIQARAENVAHLSGERIAAELAKLLAAPVPSVGLRLLADTGLLAPISAELAAQRGIPQNKIPGDDLWDHTLRTVDAAAAAGDPVVLRLAALLHDIGKPSTMADGRFLRHDSVGAELAGALLDRLRWKHDERDRVVRLIRHHMFGYQPSWSDAAVRRFIAKVGPDLLDDLFRLRAADDTGSGWPAGGSRVEPMRTRVAQVIERGIVLTVHDLAIGGRDLMDELAIPQGPRLGAVLRGLLRRAIADPSVNTRHTLLAIARSLQEDAS